MKLREYNNSDFLSFVGLVKSAWSERSVYDAVDYQLIDPFWYEDNILHNPEYILLVAEHNSQVVSFIVGRVSENSMKIVMLFTDIRWRKKGIAQMLKSKLTEKAGELHLHHIFSINRYDNEASYQLNNRMGWRITELTDDYYKASLVLSHKTLDEWDKISGYTILDPDGFDRKDEYLYLRRFSEEEYRAGLQRCTLIGRDADKIAKWDYKLLTTGENNER